MSNLDWSTIVGAAPATPETTAEAKRLSVALSDVRSNLTTSPHAANALQSYIELAWLSLAHQEQVDKPGESKDDRAQRIFHSVSERRALQRLSSELFTDLRPHGTVTSGAGETPSKNKH